MFFKNLSVHLKLHRLGVGLSVKIGDIPLETVSMACLAFVTYRFGGFFS